MKSEVSVISTSDFLFGNCSVRLAWDWLNSHIDKAVKLCNNYHDFGLWTYVSTEDVVKQRWSVTGWEHFTRTFWKFQYGSLSMKSICQWQCVKSDVRVADRIHIKECRVIRLWNRVVPRVTSSLVNHKWRCFFIFKPVFEIIFSEYATLPEWYILEADSEI